MLWSPPLDEFTDTDVKDAHKAKFFVIILWRLFGNNAIYDSKTLQLLYSLCILFYVRPRDPFLSRCFSVSSREKMDLPMVTLRHLRIGLFVLLLALLIIAAAVMYWQHATHLSFSHLLAIHWYPDFDPTHGC